VRLEVSAASARRKTAGSSRQAPRALARQQVGLGGTCLSFQICCDLLPEKYENTKQQRDTSDSPVQQQGCRDAQQASREYRYYLVSTDTTVLDVLDPTSKTCKCVLPSGAKTIVLAQRGEASPAPYFLNARMAKRPDLNELNVPE
jgi:hypothetical protein